MLPLQETRFGCIFLFHGWIIGLGSMSVSDTDIVNFCTNNNHNQCTTHISSFTCRVGYAYINQYQQGHHRDDYETVHDPAEPIQGQGHCHDRTSSNTDSIVEPQSPQMGLEMFRPPYHQGSTKHANDDENTLADSHNNHESLLPTLPFTDQLKSHVEGNAEEFHDEDQDSSDDSHVHDHDNGSGSSIEMNETQQVCFIVQKPAACIFLVFFVTLGLFPGWVSQLRSAHECRAPYFRLQNDLYTPAAFCLFNSGDLAGRILSAQFTLSRIHNLSNKLIMGAMLRFIFIPLFFLCVGGSRDGRATSATGFVIHSDVYSLAIQTLFSVTNGLLLTTAFAHAPSLRMYKNDRPRFSTLQWSLDF
jgi:Nucleoside transporter